MNITITASDGKEFKGTDYQTLVKQVVAYESDLKIKAERDAAERKVREEKTKQLTQYKAKKLKEINELAITLSKMVKEYEEKSKMKLYYSFDCFNRDFEVKETTNTLDMEWDDLVDNIINAVRKY